MKPKKTSSLLLSTTVTSLISAALPASAALLAHYSFDSDFADSSANSNNLTVGGGTPAITGTVGEFVFGGGGLDLVGGDNEFLSLGSTISFGTSDAWTVSFWARRRPGTTAATGMVIGEDDTNGGFIWNTANASQVDGLRFRPSSVSTGAGNNDFAAANDTDFHHWVVVVDGSNNLTVYRDNVAFPTVSAVPDTLFNIDTIGDAYSGTSLSFDGQLDEIYIFDEAIDSAAVNSLFSSNTIPEPASWFLAGIGGVIAVGRRRRK